MKRLEDFTDDEIANIKIGGLDINVLVFASKINECDKNKICAPGEYFECVEECKLCGKLR